MADTTPTIFGFNILGDRGPASATVTYWKSLYYFNLYRLALAVFFATAVLSGAKIGSFGSQSPRLFLMAGLAYGLFGLINLVTISRGKPEFRTQARLQILGDIVLFTLLMYASGGVQSGIGLLMIVSVAAAGVALGGRMAIAFAALATIAVFTEHMTTLILGGGTGKGSTEIGLLGTGLFATAFLFYGLVKRINQTEALAKQRGIDLANLAQLNELIIQRMQVGVLATDADERVRVLNDTARHLLGVSGRHEANPPLARVSPELAVRLAEWWQQQDAEDKSFLAQQTGTRITPRFIGLGAGHQSGTLIFLEDTTLVEAQAQQLKLAALGRLTAGIAHEIRNPLGALSHAGQLLAESADIDKEDRRLVRIIKDQCTRMNQLIEDVMQLGRRDHVAQRVIDLHPWLQEFTHYYIETQELAEEGLCVNGAPVSVCTDPNQLNQIVFNLCQNAVRHSPPFTGTALVTLETGIDRDTARPFLNVIDQGNGIPPEIADKIFEPFFTTEATGTGLGLYIARELCEGNQCRLEYFPSEKGGSRFRITFARPEKWDGTNPEDMGQESG